MKYLAIALLVLLLSCEDDRYKKALEESNMIFEQLNEGLLMHFKELKEINPCLNTELCNDACSLDSIGRFISDCSEKELSFIDSLVHKYNYLFDTLVIYHYSSFKNKLLVEDQVLHLAKNSFLLFENSFLQQLLNQKKEIHDGWNKYELFAYKSEENTYSIYYQSIPLNIKPTIVVTYPESFIVDYETQPYVAYFKTNKNIDTIKGYVLIERCSGDSIRQNFEKVIY